MSFNILYAASPVLIAALGALLTEYAGFLLIGIEGFMVLGSFGCFILTVWTGSAIAGTVITAVLCAVAGFLLCSFVKRSGSDPFIAGIALNLAAQGLCGALSLRFFGTGGVLRDAAFAAPLPVGLPLAGHLLLPQPPFVYVALVCLAAEAVFLKTTVPGFRLMAAGLSAGSGSSDGAVCPAVVERGIDPWRCREGAWAAAAFLAALAGCAVSFRVGVYAPGGTGGRAWIALAAVYLGFRNVWGILAASLVFALAENLAFGVQGLFQNSASYGTYALAGIPSALALALYVLASRLARDRRK
ncbi:MAG: ABC transporter permease [Spirochaetaceae bacterium]|nr:ABC transporter permease [Spirochaetaceae bacterium]